MKRLDAKELTLEFNDLRQKNQGREFTATQLNEFMHRHGFNDDLTYFMKKQGVFNVSKVSGSATKLYKFKEEPLYHKGMDRIINDWRKTTNRRSVTKKEEPLSEEEVSIQNLKNKGYQIQKLIGFDESRFAKENPELYRKYLIYESV